MTLSAEYYSGGAAAGLKGEIHIRPHNKYFEGDQFADFIFAISSAVKVTAIGDVMTETLDEVVKWKHFAQWIWGRSKPLYEVLIDGTVFDVGGRANKTSEIIPLTLLRHILAWDQGLTAMPMKALLRALMA